MVVRELFLQTSYMSTIFTEKHVLALTQYRPSGTFRLEMPQIKYHSKKLLCPILPLNYQNSKYSSFHTYFLFHYPDFLITFCSRLILLSWMGGVQSIVLHGLRCPDICSDVQTVYLEASTVVNFLEVDLMKFPYLEVFLGKNSSLYARLDAITHGAISDIMPRAGKKTFGRA